MKEGQVVKSWKKRWFILAGYILYYKRRPEDLSPRGMISLTGSTVREVTDHVPSTPFCFEIRTENYKAVRTYYLSASNEAEMKYWMELIRVTIEKKQRPRHTFHTTEVNQTQSDRVRKSYNLASTNEIEEGVPGSPITEISSKTNFKIDLEQFFNLEDRLSKAKTKMDAKLEFFLEKLKEYQKLNPKNENNNLVNDLMKIVQDILNVNSFNLVQNRDFWKSAVHRIQSVRKELQSQASPSISPKADVSGEHNNEATSQHHSYKDFATQLLLITAECSELIELYHDTTKKNKEKMRSSLIQTAILGVCMYLQGAVGGSSVYTEDGKLASTSKAQELKEDIVQVINKHQTAEDQRKAEQSKTEELSVCRVCEDEVGRSQLEEHQELCQKIFQKCESKKIGTREKLILMIDIINEEMTTESKSNGSSSPSSHNLVDLKKKQEVKTLQRIKDIVTPALSAQTIEELEKEMKDSLKDLHQILDNCRSQTTVVTIARRVAFMLTDLVSDPDLPSESEVKFEIGTMNKMLSFFTKSKFSSSMKSEHNVSS